MKVLSLFDGMSCGQLALKRAGISYDSYYASEINKYSMAVTKHHFPNTIFLGDVEKIDSKALPQIDLLIGGSPCQGFSYAGKHLNFEDPRSKLFFDYVRLLNECKPTYFFLENVRMKEEHQQVISSHLGVNPIEIESKLVSGQLRKRLYWTNIPDVTQPEDKGISFQSILEKDEARIPKAYALTATYFKKGGEATRQRNFDKSQRPIAWIDDHNTRWLTPIECERLQNVEDNHTLIPWGKRTMSDTQRYQMLGNGWTIDVIAHIFKNLDKEPYKPNRLF